MSIIHNGQEIKSKDILLDKWKFRTVTGEEKPKKPSLCIFQNTAKALQMLNKHIERNSRIVLSTDVDVDGIGTTYILKKVLNALSSTNHLLLINKEKVHGIQEKHVKYFKQNKIDLMIITDSSCNEIDIIKNFNCDVLVIDHHELLHRELYGKCNDNEHEFVIVNNTIENSMQIIDNEFLKSSNNTTFDNIEPYLGDSDMSCGLVVYELMRVYCSYYSSPKILENLMLYQWCGVTLFTDAINTLTERNQWYLDKTVFSMSVEHSLWVMLQAINKYKATLDKSYINYSLAPIINKAIRAGHSNEALDCVINNPSNIYSLNIYNELQQQAIEKALYVIHTKEDGTVEKVPKVFDTDNILIDISNLGIHTNYTGVIAGRASGDNNKNAAVFKITEQGLCKGSFRGRYKKVDYRKYFEEYSHDIYAQGHPPAFGFECTYEQLLSIMNSLGTIEPTIEEKPYITLGKMSPSEYGVYHVTDLEEFKRLGYIWKIATGNSKVSSIDEITIRVKASDVKLKETKGKLYIYDVLGLECKAFKLLSGSYFDIYIEFTNEITMYIR